MPRWPKLPPNSVSSVRTTEGDRRLPMPPAGTPDAPTVLTTAELCARWRCTPRTLERMARDGRIRRLKLRGGVRYPVDEIQRIERGEDRASVIVKDRIPGPHRPTMGSPTIAPLGFAASPRPLDPHGPP